MLGSVLTILNAIAEKLKRQSKDDFKGRQFEAWLIVQAVTWYLRYPLSYRDQSLGPCLCADDREAVAPVPPTGLWLCPG